MATYNDIITQLLSEIGDTGSVSLSTAFSIALCEMCVNIIQLVVKPLITVDEVDYPLSVLPGYIPITDINLLPRTSDSTLLTDAMSILVVRDDDQHELSHNSVDTLIFFSDALSATGDVSEYYTIASNLIGIRRVPTTLSLNLFITYVGYISVNSLSDTFPLDDSFIALMVHLLHVFIAARYSQFELAKKELDTFTNLIGARNVG